MANLLRRIYRRGALEVTKGMLANRYYNWYVFSRQLSDKLRRKIEVHYSNGDRRDESGKSTEVVVVHNGWTESGGLADRLRGIVSTYLLCKEMGRQFRILFTHPFPLEMFLQPNEYDWHISEHDMTFTSTQAAAVCLEVGSESRWQTRRQKAFLLQGIESAGRKQVHVYTNALFAYFEGFGQAFQELFKPSERLQMAIDRELQTLGEGYVSVSARFLGVLGDFKDTMEENELPAEKQELLLQACMTELEQIHQKHPHVRMLANSDSITFLQRAQQLPYVYSIPGHILHLDVTEGTLNEEQLYQTYEKTMLDFFMIAHASEVYRLQGRWMRTSGFPYAASLVYEKPFHEAKVNV